MEKRTILSRGDREEAWAIPKMIRTPEDNALIVLQDRQGGDWGKPILPVAVRSTDGGENWGSPQALLPPNFPRMNDCIFKPTGLEDKRLLLSQVPGPGRKNLTLSIGSPDGASWSPITIIDPDPTAYSDICMLPNNQCLVVYESGRKTSRNDLRLAAFNLEWLLAQEKQ